MLDFIDGLIARDSKCKLVGCEATPCCGTVGGVLSWRPFPMGPPIYQIFNNLRNAIARIRCGNRRACERKIPVGRMMGGRGGAMVRACKRPNIALLRPCTAAKPANSIAYAALSSNCHRQFPSHSPITRGRLFTHREYDGLSESNIALKRLAIALARSESDSRTILA